MTGYIRRIGPYPSPQMLAVARVAIEEGRAKQIERQDAKKEMEQPSGATAAERNDARLGALLRGALPDRSATDLQTFLDIALETLAREHAPSTFRILFDEYRAPLRFATTPLSPETRMALNMLLKLYTSCAEPEDDEQAEATKVLGIDSDTALMGKGAATAQRGRRKGSHAAVKQRVEAASPRHERWHQQAKELLAIEASAKLPG